MSEPVIVKLVLVIDLNHGGRVILGLTPDGKLHSGAFNTLDPRPMVHDGHFEVEKEEAEALFDAARATGLQGLMDEYVALDEKATFRVHFVLDTGPKEVVVFPPDEAEKLGKELEACPEALWTFLRLFWDQNRW